MAMKPALMATMLAAKSFAATSSAGIKPAKRPGSAAVAVAKRSGATAGPAVAWPWRSVLGTSSAELASLGERLRLCLSARDEMAKALSETEKKVPYTFKEDHDLIMQCKTAITPLIRAIPKLTEACEALEADGAAALWRLQAEQELLRSGQVGTVQQLLSEREAAYTALRTELVEVEEGHDFSVRALLSRLAKEQEAHRATEERRAELDEERQDLSAQLDALKKDMAILKADHQVALEEERRRHARTRAELCAEVGILKGELVLLERSSEQTAEELMGRLGASLLLTPCRIPTSYGT